MSTNSFLGVFAKSPLKPIEDHIDLVDQCTQLLAVFFQHVYQCDWISAEAVQQQISQLEKQADKVKRELRTNLPTGLFMPIQRQDILALITQQDKLANKAKDISGRIIGRQLQIPESLQESFNTYLLRCLDASTQAKNVINELDELLEAGFKGREVDLVERMIAQLDEIEDETDSLQIIMRSSLMKMESGMNPVDVMFLYNIIELVGGLADTAERIGARLELMLAG
ncbi:MULTISPECIES: TIGR00153 family protein [Alteromonadaceae]|uniref:TIGR00153 family protein n=1 Tax=Alteromonadaceae TaxID=72275 RepID=UPI001C0A474C|nr:MULTISPECIES: TIGR00153 family protein [Aliiglaciecola]MBU2876552.1 TIGR00153 family protein [Aliiglaciecola lipolytica]MDO6711513.1 TIGR00153 family protein [Aliiglaciecola sp. 2_MG-2023]MDO6752511.1 TIGR00153 family protein [Aliiglaciecola sp. 1_MG-2023]